MTPLERRCRWLLLAYPAWYRRRRGEEMLGTLLEASLPGGRWPFFRDARALVLLRARDQLYRKTNAKTSRHIFLVMHLFDHFAAECMQPILGPLLDPLPAAGLRLVQFAMYV